MKNNQLTGMHSQFLIVLLIWHREVFFQEEDEQSDQQSDQPLQVYQNQQSNVTNQDYYQPAYFGFAKIYAWGDPTAPAFPDDYTIVRSDVLQVLSIV